jgi:hypothetical protein
VFVVATQFGSAVRAADNAVNPCIMGGVSGGGTICAGGSATFSATPAGNSTFPSGQPTWTVQPTSAGTLSANSGTMTTFTPNADFFDTATITASCGTSSARSGITTVIKLVMDRPHDKTADRTFHYAFNDSAPGVCKVACIATVTPDDAKTRAILQGAVQWTLASIEGSTLTWLNSGVGVYSEAFHDWREEASYSGLPTDNAAFGAKGATVAISGLNCPQNGSAKIFFDMTAKNHPGSGSGTTPNWYYYWSQTGADNGSHSYDDSIVAPTFGKTVWENGQWVAKIGRDDYQSTGRYGGVDGIDHFANTVRHENQHVTDLGSWWPTGYNNSLDGDGDVVPDSLEPSLGYDPNATDTDGDGDRDVEDHAYDNQPDWDEGSADSSDWAKNGHQWGSGYSNP